MKTVLLIIAISLSLASFGQTEVVLSEQFSNTRLDKALKQIRKNHDLRFAYDGRLLKRHFVTADLRNKNLKEGLFTLFAGTGLEARFLGSTIAILAAEPVLSSSKVAAAKDLTWNAKVLDRETGESLPFASVQVRGTNIGTRSNEEGFFTLRHIPTDIDIILISYVGYETTPVILENYKSEYPSVISLSQNLSVLPLVPIYGEQTKMQEQSTDPGLVTLQNSATRFIPTAGEPDIIRALQYLPGIGATGESSGNIHIRGGASDENLVLYDGFTVYHLDHFYGIFSAFNPESVKNIRVHKGWFEPRFGGRTAGLLEVTGKDGNSKQTAATVNLNMLAANAQIETPLPFKDASFIITARRSLTDVLATSVYKQIFNSVYNASLVGGSDADTDVFESEAPNFRFNDLSMRLSLRPTHRDEVNFSLYSASDKLQFGFDHDFGEATSVKFQDDSDWGNLGASGKWVRDWNGESYSSTIVSYSRYHSDLFALDRNYAFGELQDSIFTDEHTVLEEYALKQHVEFRLESHEIATGLWLTNRKNNFRSQDTEGDESELRENQTTTAVYVQDKMQLGFRASALFGVRMSHYTGTNTVYAEPRASFTYKLNSDVTLKAAGGRFYQFIRRIRRQNLFLNTPDFWRMSDLNSVPVLRSDQVMAGFSYSMGKWVLDVEGYYRSIDGVLEDKDQIQLGSEPLEASDYLTGTGEVLGVDVSLQRTVGRHTGWLSGTFVRSDRSFETLDQGFVRSTFQPETEFNAVYVFRLPHWRFTATFVYGTGRPFTEALGTYPLELINGDEREIIVFGDVNGSNLPDYHRMDVSLYYFINNPTSNLEVGVSFYNLYNRRNITSRDYYLESSTDEDIALGMRDLRSLGLLPSLSLRIEF